MCIGITNVQLVNLSCVGKVYSCNPHNCRYKAENGVKVQLCKGSNIGRLLLILWLWELERDHFMWLYISFWASLGRYKEMYFWNIVKRNYTCWGRLRLLTWADLKYCAALHACKYNVSHGENCKMPFKGNWWKYLALIAVLGGVSCVFLCSIAFNSEQS